MNTSIKLDAPLGTSLKSLIKGFVLTKQTEGKSARTVEYYRDNLRRFLWFVEKQSWPDDVSRLTEWQIREFLGYVAGEINRWGLKGNGSETSKRKATHSTVFHYFVALSCFFNWINREGFVQHNPMTKIEIAKPKPRIITPYRIEEIKQMLAVCDYDLEHHAKFLGSRNRAIILVLLDSGVRLSELVGMKISDIDQERGHIRVLGKGSKERMVRIGKTAQRALWHYLVYRPENGKKELWQLPMFVMIRDMQVRHPGVTASDESIRELYANAYHPLRAEGFFAKKIILVEGATEQYSLPIYAEAAGYLFDNLNISVVDCGGKGCMDRLYRIFNELGIPCYLLFDYDKENGDAKMRAKSRELLQLFGQPSDPPSSVLITECVACFPNKWEIDLAGEISDLTALTSEARNKL
jgi:site-specific recombinase XerD